MLSREIGPRMHPVQEHVEGALDKYNIIPKLFPKVGVFIPLEVLA